MCHLRLYNTKTRNPMTTPRQTNMYTAKCSIVKNIFYNVCCFVSGHSNKNTRTFLPSFMFMGLLRSDIPKLLINIIKGNSASFSASSFKKSCKYIGKNTYMYNIYTIYLLYVYTRQQ